MKQIIRIFIVSFLVIFGALPFSTAASKDIQEIADAYSVFPSHWSSGSCGSTVNYKPGSSREPQHLDVTFDSLSGPISFSIFDIKAGWNKNDPGLHEPTSWYENSFLRVNHTYVTYVDSMNELSLPPKPQGKFRVQVYVSVYPAKKETVQLELWVQNVSTKETTFGADLAFHRNCK